MTFKLIDKGQPIIANKKGKSFVYGYSYPEEDIKEFIRLLKEVCFDNISDKYENEIVSEEIDNLSGFSEEENDI